MSLPNNQIIRQFLSLILLMGFLLQLQAAELTLQKHPRFAYAVNSFDNSLSMYTVEPQTGRLIPNGHAETGHFPSAVGIHPSGRFVYVLSQAVDSIQVFSVNKNTGRLTETKASPFYSVVASSLAMVIDPQGKYLYAPGRYSNAVMGLAIDAQTGDLSPIPGAPFPAGERPRQIAMHPSGRFVYVANEDSNNISAYAVNTENGALSPVPGSPFNPGYAPIVLLYTPYEEDRQKAGKTYNLTIDPRGKYLYVANWMSSSVSAFSINPKTGKLSSIKGSPFITKPHPYSLTVGPGGDYLYTANWYLNEINGYEIHRQTGALLSSPDLAFSAYGKAPIMVVARGQTDQLYVSNYDSNEINLFAVDPVTGVLTLKDISLARTAPRSFAFVEGAPVKRTSSHAVALNAKNRVLTIYQINPLSGDFSKTESVKTQDDPVAAIIDPVSRKIYVANGKQNSVSVFQLLEKTGKLQEINGSPFDVGVAPDSLAIGDNGRYLYVSNAQFKFVNIYAIAPQSGALSRVSFAPVYMDNTPDKVFIEPLGRFAYILSKKDHAISVLRYNKGKEPLFMKIKEYGSPFAVKGGPVFMATDPVGRFAYVVKQNTNNVAAFSINTQTGALQEIQGSPYQVGKNPVSIAVHPSGQFVYILNKRSGSVSIANRDQRTGTLSKPLHVGVGKNPHSLFVDASGKYLYVGFAISGEIKKYGIDQKTGSLTQMNSTHLGRATKLTGLLLNIE